MSTLKLESYEQSVSRTVTTDSIEPFRTVAIVDRSIRVLLISHELITRAGLRHLLEASGFTVAESRPGEEALRVLNEERPDIVLLDADSCWGAESFCQEVLGGSVRAIVLSERAQWARQRTLLESGAMGLVMKDEPPAMLLKAISKVHQGEAWLDRAHMAELLARLSGRKRFENAEEIKIASLTTREREIISLLGDGLKNEAIALRLLISQATVRNHLTSILDKLGMANRFELAVYAFRHGLVRAASNPALPSLNKTDRHGSHRK